MNIIVCFVHAITVQNKLIEASIFLRFRMEVFMRASRESYEKVAQHCSEYDRNTKCSCKNSTMETDEVSCLNCSHFDKDQYCKLNLYDKIKQEHDF